jgi:hypothetical protein
MCELKKARLASVETEAKRGDIVRMIGKASYLVDIATSLGRVV